MFLAAAPLAVGAAGAAYAYLRPGDKPGATTDDQHAVEANGDATDAETEGADVGEALGPASEEASGDGDKTAGKSWRASAGRDSGPEGYVFGDLTRGVVVRLRGEPTTKEEDAIEAEGDERYSHVQVLVRDAIRIFRARGYTGTINMSQTVGHFSESTAVRVDGPKDGVVPWEDARGDSAAEAASIAMGEHGKAGKVFATLLARLERRAAAWESFSGDESLDPSLTSSAHIGFSVPIIKIGWGVSVSLTVTTSSLLRYAKYAAGHEWTSRVPSLVSRDDMQQAELTAHAVAESSGCE